MTYNLFSQLLEQVVGEAEADYATHPQDIHGDPRRRSWHKMHLLSLTMSHVLKKQTPLHHTEHMGCVKTRFVRREVTGTRSCGEGVKVINSLHSNFKLCSVCDLKTYSDLLEFHSYNLVYKYNICFSLKKN